MSTYRILFSIAWSNLVSNVRNSVAAVGSVALAFVAVALFSGFVRDIHGQFSEIASRKNMLGDVVITKAPRDSGWPPNLRQHEQKVVDQFLRKEEGNITAIVRKLYVSGIVDNGRTSTMFVGYGTDVAQGVVMRGARWAWNTIAGRPLQVELLESPSLVSPGLAKILGCRWKSNRKGERSDSRPGEQNDFECDRLDVQLLTFTSRSQLNALDVNLQGVIDPGRRKYDDRYLVVPLDTAQSLLATDEVSVYSIKLKDPERTTKFSSDLIEFARQQLVDIDAGPWETSSYGSFFRSITSFLGAFKWIMLVLFALVGTMSVVNTVTRSVAERTKEIGTLRSMGFRRFHIEILFAMEGVLMGLLACCFGSVAATIIGIILDSTRFTYASGVANVPLPLHIKLHALTFAQVGILLCLLCTIAAWVPARRVARQKICVALNDS